MFFGWGRNFATLAIIKVGGRLICCATVAVLAACVENSAGSYTIGQTFSPMWFATAPEADKRALMASYDMAKLCSQWRSAYNSGRRESIRVLISRELDRRGRPVNEEPRSPIQTRSVRQSERASKGRTKPIHDGC